jgi:hypothetical protein
VHGRTICCTRDLPAIRRFNHDAPCVGMATVVLT